MSTPRFTADDWAALCRFLEQQRQHYCASRLIPERFKMMVVPETLDQRRAAAVIVRRSFGPAYGWATVADWQQRIEQLREQDNATGASAVPAPSGDGQ